MLPRRGIAEMHGPFPGHPPHPARIKAGGNVTGKAKPSTRPTAFTTKAAPKPRGE